MQVGKSTTNTIQSSKATYIPSTRKIGLTQQARNYINELKSKSKEEGKTKLILVCNDIQRDLGVVNRPSGICTAMYDCMDVDDEVLFAPPSGKSTTVKIKYPL